MNLLSKMSDQIFNQQLMDNFLLIRISCGFCVPWPGISADILQKMPTIQVSNVE